jgi:hypothetical protein
LPDNGKTDFPYRLSAKKRLGYWRGRLFKNTFTHDGKRFRTNSWAVKIQYLGKRKTFTLQATNRSKAALEAFRIFQILVLQGWDAVTTQQAYAPRKGNPRPSEQRLSRQGNRSRSRHQRLDGTRALEKYL